jgi:hypothetical protein
VHLVEETLVGELRGDASAPDHPEHAVASCGRHLAVEFAYRRVTDPHDHGGPARIRAF